MLNCTEASRLIARSIDAALDAKGRARLAEHLKLCPSCRAEAETQILVRRVLAARPDERLPSGFAARLSARLDAERASNWLEVADWKTWSIRLLPIAAGMLLFAGIVDRTQRARWAEEQAARILSGVPPGVDVSLFAASDVAKDRLIAEMVMGQSVADGKEALR